MHFLVRSIIEHNLLEGARLVAGEQGNNNRILWINLMEILDSPDSLQKGELLITTGYGLDDESRYRGLIGRLNDWGLSGMLIQPGYYIDHIPEYILKEADAHGFPVIELPKSLTFSHIMHVLLEHIALRQDFYSDPDLAAIRTRLAQGGGEGPAAQLWARASDRAVHLLLLSPGVADREGMFSQGLERLQTFLSGYAAAHLEAAGGRALLLLALHEGVSLRDMLFAVSSLLPSPARQDRLNLLIGAGTARRAAELTTALDEACECGEALRKAGAMRGVCTRSEIGLFALIESLQQGNGRSLLLAHDALRDISEQDRLHGTEYLRTLRIYLHCGGNNAEASSRLNIHRHTLKKRLEKMQELGGCRLEEYYARLHISLALLISDCYSP